MSAGSPPPDLLERDLPAAARRAWDALMGSPRLVPGLVLDHTLRPLLLRRRRGVRCEGSVHLRGRPLIDLAPGASLTIGDGVMLNSRNEGYHLNMHSPVKLMADRPGAAILIGARSRIHGTCIHAYDSVTVGVGCLIAANTQIMDGSGHDLALDDPTVRLTTRGDVRPVVLEDHVWVGAGVTILPGVTIGRGSVVAAGSVVVRDIPRYSLAGGNPATVIREHRGATT